MGYRAELLAPGHIYHVYNRGVNKMAIFLDNTDRQRFIDAMIFYLPRVDPGGFVNVMRGIDRRERTNVVLARRPVHGSGLVDLLTYCLMDNHIHLLLHENIEQGISRYLQRLLTSYAKYFNTKYKREGPLFSGRFRATRVTSDEHFLHLTRYIHLNPYVAGLVNDPVRYQWSSLPEYLGSNRTKICHSKLLKSMMNASEYKDFVNDYADYARELESIKHVLLE